MCPGFWFCSQFLSKLFLLLVPVAIANQPSQQQQKHNLEPTWIANAYRHYLTARDLYLEADFENRAGGDGVGVDPRPAPNGSEASSATDDRRTDGGGGGSRLSTLRILRARRYLDGEDMRANVQYCLSFLPVIFVGAVLIFRFFLSDTIEEEDGSSVLGGGDMVSPAAHRNSTVNKNSSSPGCAVGNDRDDRGAFSGPASARRPGGPDGQATSSSCTAFSPPPGRKRVVRSTNSLSRAFGIGALVWPVLWSMGFWDGLEEAVHSSKYLVSFFF